MKNFTTNNAQIAHFVARFKRAIKDRKEFTMDNLGVFDDSNSVRDSNGVRTWTLYDNLDQLVNANTHILASGDRTHVFGYARGGKFFGAKLV